MTERKPEATSVKSLACPNCGGQLQKFNPYSRYIGCSHCGAQLDATTDQYQIVEHLQAPAQYKPYSFVRLGRQVFIQGRLYRVIGRARWQSDYFERWSEEGSTGYSREKWQYDEWLLLDAEGGYLWLIEDAEGFNICESFMPPNPYLPQLKGGSASFTGANKPLEEYGASRAIFFEGESTYRVTLEDALDFWQVDHDGGKALCEYRKNKRAEYAEMDFFIERKAPKSGLRRAFDFADKNAAVLKPTLNELPKFTLKKFVDYAFVGAMALIVVLMIIGANTRKVEQSWNFELKDLATGAKQLDAFTFENAHSLYELQLDVFPEAGAYTDVYVSAVLLDEEKRPLNIVEGMFGIGTEETSASVEFGVKEPRKITLEVSAAAEIDLVNANFSAPPPDTSAADSTAISASALPAGLVVVTLETGGILYRYYILLMIALLLGYVGFRVWAKSNLWWRVEWR